MKKNIIILLILLMLIATGCQQNEFKLTPKERAVNEANQTGSTEVGTGWSSKENPIDAVKEAVDMALEGKTKKNPKFAIIYATSGSNMSAILSEAKKILGNNTQIFGGSSDSRAVMTNKGFVKAAKKGYEQSLMEGKTGLAIMTVDSKEITFGAGASDITAYSSPQEASKAALADAIKNAGKSENEKPNLILLTVTQGQEEEVLEGIEEAVGKSAIVLGGTAGGPKQSVFGKDKVYEKGISLAVIYTDLPIGWTFEGGFDVTSPHSGIVTKVDGQAIVEIDNKPALEVYDDWLDGKIEKLHKELNDSSAIRDLLTLSPLYRKYTSPSGQDYFLFSHPWPKDDTLKEKSVMTSTKIKVGERVYLSQGTWETLVNRIGNLPTNAKVKAGMIVSEKPILSMGVICAGVLGTIPETERDKLPVLINYADKDACYPGQLKPYEHAEEKYHKPLDERGC